MARGNYTVQTEDYKGHKIEIYYDEEPESPREWDNLGTIYTNNLRHNFDGHSIKDFVRECGKNPENYDAIPFHLFSKDYIWLKVYAYEHSGMTISVADSNPYPDGRWDSYLLGVIAVSKKHAREVYGWKVITPSRAEKVKEVLKAEIEVLDDYVQGNVYGFVTEDEKGNEIDSCFGYYGDEGLKEAIADAKADIDATIENKVA